MSFSALGTEKNSFGFLLRVLMRVGALVDVLALRSGFGTLFEFEDSCRTLEDPGGLEGETSIVSMADCFRLFGAWTLSMSLWTSGGRGRLDLDFIAVPRGCKKGKG